MDRELTAQEATEELFNKPCDLQKEMLRYEGALIKQALAKTNGRLTEAASQLTVSYQALAYIIDGRREGLSWKKPVVPSQALTEEVGIRTIGNPQRCQNLCIEMRNRDDPWILPAGICKLRLQFGDSDVYIVNAEFLTALSI